MKTFMAAVAILFAASTAHAQHCGGRHVWCPVSVVDGLGDSYASVWRTETKIVRVGVQRNPLSPTYILELENDLCEQCENRSNRIVYISTRIASDEDGIAAVAMSAMEVFQMFDVAKMAMLHDKTVRIAVRTDLAGKRSVSGKFRDPVVRIAVLR